ncbi:hypothetical protein CUC15_16675 [Oceanobacillus zhaokaii]|uniref:Polysaccharide biosynthesis protein C-terminal domain-containing protein n=1 Tax=Oceanobacillus zhaokaii TaxID=2052660 RepID=A0A345PKD8_9BACI|nr:hypothetical protein [Oceanobacillus zhaokaii]AXI10468.1 hypothetical protein CUC15_16675 [Oceanobacillus zhaokaii]
MIKNLILSLSNKFSNVILKLIVTVLIARNLGPDGFGDYSLFLTVSASTTLIFLFGTHNFLLNRSKNIITIRKYNNIIRKYYFIIFILMFFISFIAFGFFYNLINATILALFFSVQYLFFVYQYQFMALNLYNKLVVYNVIFYLVLIICSAVFTPNNFIIYLLFYSAAGITAIVSYSNILIPRNLKLSRMDLLLLRYQFRISSKNFLIDINSIIQQRLDFFILYFFGGSYVAGIFAAVKNISESILYIPKSIQPIIIQEKNDTQLYKLFKIINLVLVFIMIVGILFSQTILTLVFGSNYEDGNIILKITFIIIYIYSLTLILSAEYIRQNIQSIALRKSVITTIVMIIILLIASQFDHILLSISLGTLISYLVLLLLLFLSSYIPFNIFHIAIKDIKYYYRVLPNKFKQKNYKE